MRHPSKVGSFCARYVRRGWNYDRAKEQVHTKMHRRILREQQKEQLRLEREALAALGIKDTVLDERE